MPSPKLVVYVEDNAANFELIRKVLEAGGHYRVVGAETGEEGLATARRLSPALVLVDLDLPGINGIEVARRLKREPHTGEIPVVAISASVMKRERTDALEAGCAWFIEKPFDIDELREVVAHLVDGAPAPAPKSLL